MSYALVIGCLVVFFVLARAGAPIGLAFFIWIGIVNMFLIAQFWSYANDLYTEEQGKRLFAIIAIGGSLGAIVGPQLARSASTYALLVVAAAILLVGAWRCSTSIERVHVRAPRRRARRRREPIGGAGGFALLLRDRYLLLIAALVLVAARGEDDRRVRAVQRRHASRGGARPGDRARRARRAPRGSPRSPPIAAR